MKIEKFSDFIGKWVEFTLETGDSYESIFMGHTNGGFLFYDVTEGREYAYFIPGDKLVLIEARGENNQDKETISFDDIKNEEKSEILETKPYENKYRYTSASL